MDRRQFEAAIPQMSHTKRDCAKFLKACDASFFGLVAEYRRNLTVLLKDGRLLAFSGASNSFYEIDQAA